ncbi:MAG: glycosyltransferase family 4 protein [Chloroflexi bacterium]|nr:glycosyltransferase family 4 protein [Chloroflexota bacterium]
MKILFISNYYPPYEVGGYEQLCRDVADRLAARGHSIRVLTTTFGLERGLHTADASIQRGLRFVPDYNARLSAGLQFFLTRRRDELHNRACLRTQIRDFEPDMVFIWNMHGLPKSIALEAESAGAAVAYWLAGESPAEPDEFEHYWRRIGRSPIARLGKGLAGRLALAMIRAEGQPRPRLDHVGIVSEYLRQQGLEAGTLPPQTQVIYNGVELHLFQHAIRAQLTGPLTILQAGRVSADKGTHTTIEAIGRLAQQDVTNVRLIVAGSGPTDYAERLRQIVAQYGIAERVTFLGWQPREQMPSIMAQSHVLVLPTENQEPFARVVLEAMANGLTVISTLTGGTGEIVKHGETGLTFPAGDSAALAQQIKQLADDPALRIKLAECGQALVLENFSLDRMVENCERLLIEAQVDRGRG